MLPDLQNIDWRISVLVVWELVWKGIGLWKSARNNNRNWFIAMLVLNTIGILPMIYFLIQKKTFARYLTFFQKNK